MRPTIVILALAAVAGLGLSVFPVREYEAVMVTQFGRPVGPPIEESGPHWKAPYQSLIRFDKRLRLFDPPAAEFLTRDKKNVVVESYVAWRIREPEAFLAAAGDVSRAELNLKDILWSELSKEIGAVELGSLLTIGEGGSRLDEVSATLAARCREQTERRFGVEVVDLRVKRLGFPQQNREAVFERMKEERRREAKTYRAEGEEQAAKIRAEADRERVEILATSREEAEKIRGGAEAEAIKIYAAAHSLDPGFYEFTRSLEAYAKALQGNATLVLSTDSRFFQALTRGTEGAREGGAPGKREPASTQPDSVTLKAEP